MRESGGNVAAAGPRYRLAVPWVPLLPSDEVAPGAVAAVELAGIELVVWRASDGTPAVCDARCPHQWSHLAGAGAVDGDELVCLSHHWRFDAEGRGSKLNVKGRRDPKGDLLAFPCRERDGRLEALLPSGEADGPA